MNLTMYSHDTVPGVLDILYYLPKNTGAVDCLVPVSKARIQQVEPQCQMEVEENIYKEYFEYIMKTKGWGYPLNEEEGFNLFQSLKQLEG